MEKFSEAKIYKSKPEPRNGNVNALYFYSRAEYSNQSPVARSLFTINEHAIANVG